MILMPQIFDIIANENACYTRNELEYEYHVSHGIPLSADSAMNAEELELPFEITPFVTIHHHV